MRRIWASAVLLGVPAWVCAQTHVVKRPENVVRAVGVYEFTGEPGKATASRLVPVTVFINGELEDAGVYLARPIPFALGTGNVFEVERAGVDEGTLELAYARHRISQGNGAYDDGWLGVGAYKAKPAEKVTALKAGTVAKLEVSGGSGPKFAKKPDDDASTAAKPVDRSTAAGGGTTVSAKDDPDAPTMRKRTDTGSDASSPDDAAERPTLKRRATPDQNKAAAKKRNEASVEAVGSLNDDPDRPNLHRGKPVTRMEEEDLPPLVGIPKDMHQMVAVSDAADRPEHDFKRAWENDAERAEVMSQMEREARARLAVYGFAAVPVPVPVPVAPVVAAPARTRAVRKPAVAAAPVLVALTDEKLQGYTLSYGGTATFVYSAESPGAGGVPRYVSVVAQREPLGTVKVAMANVTDGAHLDRAPWFRLVDAVDAEASNRASLLFELRGQTTREFGLYRVIGAQADQTFVTAAAQ